LQCFQCCFFCSFFSLLFLPGDVAESISQITKKFWSWSVFHNEAHDELNA
jgi:hypothetical protein